MMANVGAFFASSSTGDMELNEEAIDLTPMFQKGASSKDKNDDHVASMLKKKQLETAWTEPLSDVFTCNSTASPDSDGNGNESHPATTRFRSSMAELNTLFTSTFCRRNPKYSSPAGGCSNSANQGSRTAPANEEPKYIIVANGTCESIIAWGKNKKLDEEQSIAFEMLAATYVLSFVEEADVNLYDGQEKENFEQQRTNLQKLARHRPCQVGPMRLFVTGPAGAGKCTYMKTNGRVL